MKVILTLKEINAAARWANEHNETVHDGKMEYADLCIRVLEQSGIVSPTVITCEACDREKVSNANSCYITDYDAV